MEIKDVAIRISLFLIIISLSGCSYKESTVLEKEKVKDVIVSTNSENNLDKNSETKRGYEQVKLNKYINPRFGYSFTYPDKFKITKESDNGDGVELNFQDSKIIVYGSNNVLQDSAKSLYEDDLKEISKKDLIDSSLEKNNYIIKWKEGNLLKYKKSIVGEESINSFEVVYPFSKEQEFIDVISKLSKSFKTPNIDKMG